MPSERRLPTSPEDGPFLLAALLCEKVLLEPDGVASAIRIVDQLVIQRVPDEALLKGAVRRVDRPFAAGGRAQRAIPRRRHPGAPADSSD